MSAASSSTSTLTADYDVAIVGAGPVGLLLANLLGAKGMRVLLLEKRAEPQAHSRAIGITPPSLEILAKLGLADAFVVRGVKIRDVFVHGETGYLGCCSFRELPGRHPYILSLPQQINMGLLEQHLRLHPQVTVRRGAVVDQLVQEPERSGVRIGFGETTITARYVVACDGWRSGVRRLMKIRAREKTYGCHFLMGDFKNRSGMKEEAHLFFTAEGAVESFPLPGGIRRWIVQTSASMPDAPAGFLSQVVRQRAGLLPDPVDQINQSAFTPRRLDAEVYHDQRVILCGDAAHAMSPIGGQGMNIGFADAEMLAEILERVLRKGENPEPLLTAYQTQRRHAASLAADRAAQGMWLGTWRGRATSLLRDYLLSEVLLKEGGMARYLGPRFAMMDVPRWEAW